MSELVPDRGKKIPLVSRAALRVLEVAVADRLRGPVGDAPNGAGRVRAGVLREERRAGDEDVRRVPDLAVRVRDRVAGVGAHDAAAGRVRGLVLRDVVGGISGLKSTIFVGFIAFMISSACAAMNRHIRLLVLVPVEGDPQ